MRGQGLAITIVLGLPAPAQAEIVKVAGFYFLTDWRAYVGKTVEVEGKVIGSGMEMMGLKVQAASST